MPVTGSSEKHRTKASDLSLFNPNQRVGDMLGARQPMGDVGNIEVLISFHIKIGWKF